MERYLFVLPTEGLGRSKSYVLLLVSPSSLFLPTYTLLNECMAPLHILQALSPGPDDLLLVVPHL